MAVKSSSKRIIFHFNILHWRPVLSPLTDKNNPTLLISIRLRRHSGNNIIITRNNTIRSFLFTSCYKIVWRDKFAQSPHQLCSVKVCQSGNFSPVSQNISFLLENVSSFHEKWENDHLLKILSSNWYNIMEITGSWNTVRV